MEELTPHQIAIQETHKGHPAWVKGTLKTVSPSCYNHDVSKLIVSSWAVWKLKLRSHIMYHVVVTSVETI